MTLTALFGIISYSDRDLDTMRQNRRKVKKNGRSWESNLGHSWVETTSVYTTQIPKEHHNLFTVPVWQTLVTDNDAYIVFDSSRRCAFLYPEWHKTEKSTDPQQSREPSKQLAKKLHYLRSLFRWGNCIGTISLKDFCSFLLSQTLQ